MSTQEPPTNRPDPKATPEPLHYALSVQFHPPIKLLRPKGLEFASKISSAIDAPGLELSEARWVLKQPMGTNPNSLFALTVQDSLVQLEASYPTDSLELFERRFDVILAEFKKLFSPNMILVCQAMKRVSLPVDGDARTFIGSHVMNFDDRRLSVLGRPVHLFGLRLFMPPFQQACPTKTTPKPTKKKKSTKKSAQQELEVVNWMIDAKVESLMEDPSKLFVEATATWPALGEWKDTEKLSEKLTFVSEYMRSNLMPFLMKDLNGSEQ